MAEVTFYFNVKNREQALAQLVGKAVAQQCAVSVLAASEAEVARLDRLLWDTPQTGFLPHCRASDEIAAQTPVVLDCRAQLLSPRQVLFNWTGEVISEVAGHDRIIEIVPQDEEQRLAARERWRGWQALGIKPVAIDMLELARQRSGGDTA
ncbi:DNA polymerase III subunit chi [Silvimonas iriomotensis]|uniref:DNA polymerase III subunit chi n=1 Tax=Silvimonas iriomotensis TaxID=449662 RepID=A0ABQ2PBA3_9NEIS|nr:DNA polymerase III subunit chi [Silvimonas iriomotensis]GGP22797.1 DNA polymerase III subunit chi [Silvimonas iriomotensis]